MQLKIISIIGLCFILDHTISKSNAADWPQWLGEKRDGVWRETNIVKEFPEKGLNILWRMPIGQGYTGPAVVGNYVYVMDRQDAPQPNQPQDPQAKPRGKPSIERLLCLDAKTGKLIWKHQWDCLYRISYGTGPRTTPVVHEGKVYALGAMGDLRCVDAKSGKLKWKRNFQHEYKAKPPVWGWSAHPVIEGDLLYCLVGGEGCAIVAFNKNTGKEVWKALTSQEVAYAPPVLVNTGGKRQLIVWLSDSINGLDADTGKKYWSHPYPADGKPQRPAVSITAPTFKDGMLFISSFYHGSVMLKLDEKKPTAEILWRDNTKNPQRPDSINMIMGTPIFTGEHIYGVGGFGHLRCIEAKTGKQLWETFKATGGKKTFLATAFLVPNQDRTFIFNDLGDLIIAKLTPKGYEEIAKTHLIDTSQNARGREVVWCHPAFANQCVYVRNDKEILCASLKAQEKK